jgi:hypothetical protein
MWLWYIQVVVDSIIDALMDFERLFQELED